MSLVHALLATVNFDKAWEAVRATLPLNLQSVTIGVRLELKGIFSCSRPV